MRIIQTGWDGAQGPIIRLNLRDLGVARDASFVATEVFVTDANNNRIARRPGSIAGAKSDGTIDILLAGRECDYDGAGGWVWLKPRFIVGVAPDGGTPTQLLLTSGFDVDTNADGIADNWSLQGTKTAAWVVSSDDPAPGVIYQAGQYQSVKHGTLTDPDYIQQGITSNWAIGDPLSVGVWHRCSGPLGNENNVDHAIFYRTGSNSNSSVFLLNRETDWYFAYGTVLSPTVETAMTMGFVNRQSTNTNRFDEAFAFKGTWRVVTIEPIRYQFRPRRRIPKSSNQIVGLGSFEVDSNGDGIADGWKKNTGVGTFSLDYLNVQHGSASQQIVIANDLVLTLFSMRRGHFRAGETWRGSIWLKISGTLTGASGLFGITIQPGQFEGGNPISSSPYTPFPSTQAAYAQFNTDLTLPADFDTLTFNLFLQHRTGTIWVDNASLTRIAP